MSELAKQLFNGLGGIKDAVQAIAPGLEDLAAETGAELSRLGVQGSMELASALFNGSGFVPYGPGQYTPSPTPSVEHAEAEVAQETLEHGIER